MNADDFSYDEGRQFIQAALQRSSIQILGIKRKYMADPQSQIVYVLTNPAMPGLVKIGKTTQLEVEERMKQLYGTGVPVPFDCSFACQVKDAA